MSHSFVGQSAWAQSLCQRIATAARFSSNVLITGPSGTGKELIARSLHDQSPRADRPFVPVDCTSLTGELFASHLFGHVKGAFTGAEHERLGCFRAADGGTLLLDEIGEMSLEMQAKLLRVLQERVVVPLGSDKPRPVDVRLIAATNRDLLAEVRANRFRLDLYYRLNVLSIATLPLAERLEDLLPLAEHFLNRLAVEQGFPSRYCSAATLEAMRRYSWPGNVRELQNVLERAAVFAEGDEIGPRAIPCDNPAETASFSTATSPNPKPPSAEVQQPAWPTLADIERQHILATLERTFCNQSVSAKLLNIDRASLARKLRRYNISLPGTRPGRPGGNRSAFL